MSTVDAAAKLIDLRDVPAALGLLTRLPVRVHTDHAVARGAQAAWAYPIAGLAVAVIAGLIAEMCLRLGLPVPFAAGLALASLIITTGAMHEDGLADTADGLWGGWDKARRLEIMKDSHIGAYGVITLTLSIGLRWLALTALLQADLLWPAICTAALLSRAAMVATMHALSAARASGLSQTVGRPTRACAAIAAALSIILSLLFWPTLWPVLTVSLATLACAGIAKAKIGGQTGDILGATQQMTEITVLLTMLALA